MNKYKITCRCVNLNTGEHEPYSTEVEASSPYMGIHEAVSKIQVKALKAGVTSKTTIVASTMDKTSITTDDGYQFEDFHWEWLI